MKKLTVLIALFLIPVTGAVFAQETEEEAGAARQAEDSIIVEGVSVPRQVEVGGEELVLNGTGMRTAFWRNYYLGALYLPEKKSLAGEVINHDGPSRIALHFIRDVSLSRMKSALDDGFENNTPEDDVEGMADRIQSFKDMFTPPTEGDVIEIDYVPERGVVVTINDEERGVVEGTDFKRAVMRIFLGEDPADDDLRDGMLGND